MAKLRLLLAACMVLCAASAQAVPITVDFVRAETPPDSTTEGLPYFMNGDTGIIFLKFKIPQIEDVIAVNSFVITVDLFDDDDGGGEVGNVEFAQPAGNLPLFDFIRLNRSSTEAAPETFTTSLCPCEIEQIMLSLLDGTFRIRVERDSGDFWLRGASVEIDAELAAPVPEPSTVSVVAGGVGAIALLIRARRRASARRLLQA